MALNRKKTEAATRGMNSQYAGFHCSPASYAARFAVELKATPRSRVRNARVLHFVELVEEVSDSTEKGFQQNNLVPLSPVRRHSKCVFVVGIGFRRFFRQ